MIRLHSIVICLFLSISAFGQDFNITDLEFLLGTWKVEGKDSFESWSKVNDKLLGESYQLKEGEKIVSETIELYNKDGKLHYVATVKNQNEGQPVVFELNPDEAGMYSFENVSHDFPKKIQYQELDSEKLFVSVLGKKNKGFSFYLSKQ